MRRFAMRVFDNLYVVRSESGIDLPANHKGCEIARAQLVNQWLSTGTRCTGTIEAHENRPHTVAGQLAAPIRDCDRNLRRQDNCWPAQKTLRSGPILIGTNGPEIEASLTRCEQRRIGIEENLTDRVGEPIVQPPRHAVPERSQVFGITAAEVLRCAHVLRREEPREEIVILGTEEWSIAVNGGFANDARLVNVVVLERVVYGAVSRLIPVVMTVRAARASLSNTLAEKICLPRAMIAASAESGNCVSGFGNRRTSF